MKFLTMALFLVLSLGIPVSVTAQQADKDGYVTTAKPIVCNQSQKMIGDISKQTGEKDVELLGLYPSPIPGIQFAYTIHRNHIKGTWTLLESASNGSSCIIAVGNFEPEKTKGPQL